MKSEYITTECECGNVYLYINDNARMRIWCREAQEVVFEEDNDDTYGL